VVKIALHGKLYLAPLEKQQLEHVLDVATGTGIWAIEFADKHPESKVIGSDLSPIQPSNVPPNCTFEIQDFEDDWIFPIPFTFIHGRFLVISLTDPLALFKQAYSALAPGGYLEMQELSAIDSIDDTFSGTTMEKVTILVNSAVASKGRNLENPKRYKALMEEAGFVDVKQKLIQFPFGPWGKSAYHKKLGAWYQRHLVGQAEGLVKVFLGRVLGMGDEEVAKISEDLKRDHLDPNIHAYQEFYVVYGRKPDT